MKKTLISLLLVLCLCMTSVAFAASGRSTEKINYSKYPDILSGTFHQPWNKGTVPKFHDYDVYACMDVMLRLDKKSSANCKVAVGVCRYEGTKENIVSYAGLEFNKSNTTSSTQYYPSSSSVYTIYGDIEFEPVAGTYSYIAKSNGPSNLAGRYAGFMSDRLG